MVDAQKYQCSISYKYVKNILMIIRDNMNLVAVIQTKWHHRFKLTLVSLSTRILEFCEGSSVCSIKCMYICSNSLWHVLWQKWSEITKCITLLWVNSNILPTRNKSFIYFIFLQIFCYFKSKKVFMLSYQWLNGYEEKYLFSFARIMIYFPPQQSVIFEHSFYCRIFLNVVTFFLCVCHYFTRVVKVSWQC